MKSYSYEMLLVTMLQLTEAPLGAKHRQYGAPKGAGKTFFLLLVL
jgi:hypothetical protein